MSIFKEIPPTAGFVLKTSEILAPLLSKKEPFSLEEDLKRYLDVEYAQITYSGTAAFYFILESLKKIDPRKKVIISSFICPLVPLAIHKAGLEVVVCDIQKDNFNFQEDQLERLCKDNNTLAILTTHLAGIPIDIDFIKKTAGNNKIFIIEDCAQSLGALYKNKKTGSLADFAFFSLCRGKGLTTYEGGAIISNRKELTPQIKDTVRRLAKDDFLSEIIKIFELVGYFIFYRRQLFWFVFGLPRAFWNFMRQPLRAQIEYFPESFPIHSVSSFRKSVGHSQAIRLGKEIQTQRQKACLYFSELNNIPGVKLIQEKTTDKANYPFVTLLFEDKAACDRIKNKLIDSGLGVSIIYALAINKYKYLSNIIAKDPCPNAEGIAECHLSLSTNAMIKETEIKRVCRIIIETLKK